MVRINLTEENLISTAGIADRRFADHSGSIQHGYELGSLTRGLVAYYPMEKGQGQVLHDGALNNLGQIEGATWNGSGKVGDDALSFDGTDDFVGTGIDSLTTPLTISFWVQLNDTSTTYAFFGNFNTTNSDLYMRYRGSDSDDAFDFTADDGSSTVPTVGSTSASTGVWYHMTGTITSDGVRELYIDGVSEATTNSSTTEYDSGRAFVIGERGGNNSFHDGLIDDVRIYDRALSQPEIEALAGLTEPSGFLVEEQDVPTLREFERDLGGAVSRYEFENDVTDSWGDNDGTDNTSAGFVDGVYGQAKDFDGNDDFISTQYSQSGVSDFTLSLWLNKSGSTGVLVSDGNSAPADRTSFIVSGDVVDIIVEDDSGNISKLSSQTFDDGEWIHSVATFKANDNTRLYINGQLENSENHSVGPPDNPNNNVAFGHDPEDGDTHYNGAIDDVRIYSRALTPIEVETLFNKGAYRIKRGNL